MVALFHGCLSNITINIMRKSVLLLCYALCKKNHSDAFQGQANDVNLLIKAHVVVNIIKIEGNKQLTFDGFSYLNKKLY